MLYMFSKWIDLSLCKKVYLQLAIVHFLAKTVHAESLLFSF